MGGDDLHLGLDFGTESVRALLAGPDGTIAATAVASYPSGQLVRGAPAAEARFDDALPPGWALQDPDDWLAAAARAVAGATGGAGPAAAQRVVSIGLDCTSCTMLPASADGAPLTRTPLADHPHAWPKLWKHHGATAQAEHLTAVARARAEPWLDRYGGIVGLEWFFPKLLQVLEEDPAVVAAAEVWLEAGDWLVWQLTGALVRSTCQAGYKAMWSPDDGYPSAAYLGACHPELPAVAAACLPGAFAAPGQPAGRLAPEAATRLGLPAGIAVSAAVIDAHAGVPGAGVSDTGCLVMVLGTSGCHMLMDSAEHRIAGVAGVVADGILPGAFGYETGQAAVGDAFDWVRRLCGGTHGELEELARQVPPGADGLAVVDWFNGCRTPLMDGRRTGAVLGAGLHHGPGHLYRATLEASAFGLAWIVDTLRDGGVAVDRFVATGGLPNQNDLFVEIVAAVLGAPVVLPQVEHGPALGAAVLGAVAAGAFPDAHAAVASMAGDRSVQPPPRVVEPKPDDVAAYLPRTRRYRELAAALPATT